MKIIDFNRKGNVVRFYLGDDDCKDYWGDDWNDRPYEDNAGTVYEQYVKGYKDMSFPFDALVLEPCTNEYSSHYSKEEMKRRLVPCIVVIPAEAVKPHMDGDGWLNSWVDDRFSRWVGSSEACRFYFGDPMEPDVIVSEKEQENIQDNI